MYTKLSIWLFIVIMISFISCKSSNHIIVHPEVKVEYETVSSGVKEKHQGILFALPDTSNRAVLQYGLGEGHAILNRYTTDTIASRVLSTTALPNEKENVMLTARAFDQFIEEVGGLLGEAWIGKKDNKLYLSFGVPMGNEYLLCSVDSTREASVFLFLSNRHATEYSETKGDTFFKQLKIKARRFKVVIDQWHPQPGAVVYGYIEMESNPYSVADLSQGRVTGIKKMIACHFKVSVGTSNQTFEKRYANEEKD